MRAGLILQYALAPDLEQQIALGEHPRTEISALARRLRPEIIDYNAARQSRSLLVRAGFFVWKPLGPVLLAWRRRRDLDVFYAGSERIGILVAASLKFSRHRPRLVVLDHNLSNPKKAFLFARLRLQYSIDAFVCLCEYQAAYLRTQLAVPRQNVFRVPWGIDGSFFCSQTREAGKHEYILSVGRENRDYETLFAALHNTGVHTKVVSSGFLGQAYPGRIATTTQHNVEMYEHISYKELRRLYDGCSFVVIPLMHGLEYPAGLTTLLESMAMGKAVVATYSRGIDDYLRDSVTGFWVEPGNPKALQEKILLLWKDPKLTRAMGKQAKESVRALVDMDRLAGQIASILAGR
jgi:glycosyltransferase involved in cell wall biosynthesis